MAKLGRGRREGGRRERGRREREERERKKREREGEVFTLIIHAVKKVIVFS